MNCLVLGANGFLGLNLVDALLASGVTPRCGRRRRSNVLALRRRSVPMVETDLGDREALGAAMAGCRTVFHAAGHYPRYSFDRAGAMAAGLSELENVLDAAAAAKVERLIYVSSTATVAPTPCGPSTEEHTYPAAPGFGTYHDLKWEMERRAAGEQRLQVTIACPGACLGPWDMRMGTSALLLGLLREADPPHPDGLVNPVDARDVATGLVRLAECATPPRRILFTAGTWTLQQLLVLASRRFGVAPPSPPLGAELAIRLADEEERRAAASKGRPAIAREIVDLVLHGVAVDTSLAERTLGMRWRPLEETLDATYEWASRMRMIPQKRTSREGCL